MQLIQMVVTRARKYRFNLRKLCPKEVSELQERNAKIGQRKGRKRVEKV